MVKKINKHLNGVYEKLNYLVSVVNHYLKYRHHSLGQCRANCAFPLVVYWIHFFVKRVIVPVT